LKNSVILAPLNQNLR
jgi:hypothetical protein